MARTVVEVRLQDRAARSRLRPKHHPYWRSISEGRHLGYYKGARAGSWVARYRKAGSTDAYEMLALGESNDRSAANGDTLLDWKQALDKANAWFELRARCGAADPPSLTVGIVVDEYITMRDARDSGRAGREVKSMLRIGWGSMCAATAALSPSC